MLLHQTLSTNKADKNWHTFEEKVVLANVGADDAATGNEHTERLMAHVAVRRIWYSMFLHETIQCIINMILHTKVFPTKIPWLKLSGKSPLDMRIPTPET